MFSLFSSDGFHFRLKAEFHSYRNDVYIRIYRPQDLAMDQHFLNFDIDKHLHLQ